MTYKPKRQTIIFFITLLVISTTILLSCEKEKIAKQKNVPELHHSVCPENSPPPPPIENTLFSSEKLKVVKKDNISTITLNLISDKVVDYQGFHQQIFRIETEGRKRKMYFALPTKYNMYWNDLKFISEKNNDSIILGFWKGKDYIKLYKIYSHKYDKENFGGGEIIIQATGSSTYTAI
ncbi:hypothetical protein [Flavobacterium suncheonense]|uniref:Lipoprotein n=1 Tax=Flavobacterium suncheonense GH29-5 = DSM 17707 TaxID=1121899 RepID=A0A0A2M1U2_9FLAO|nr:hypothetical protein [Flavobacterium suncheonense]KGO85448.1 hypothetical protein Q764_14080 [Flavobacterium suncheonense GH29-5 = DSM 17707]